MRKTIFGCLGAAAVAFALQFTPADAQAFFGACDPCNPCDEVCSPCDDAWACDPCGALDGCGPKAGKWFLNGHLEAGFFANAHGQKSTYEYARNGWQRGADDFSGNTEWLQNTRLTGGQLNQVYLSAGRSVDGRRGLDIGGTVDFTWGSDAQEVQARGLEFGAGHGLRGVDEGSWGTGDYYAAFAQAFVEAEYGRLNVKAGKFYAPFGIDSYKSTDNFFYSWSPTMTIAPTIAGGAYATYALTDRFSVLGGWAMPNEFGESSKNNAFLGGFVWTPGKRFSASYTFATGKNTYDVESHTGNGETWGSTGYDIFVHSLTATAQISKRLKYVFDWTLVNKNTNQYDSREIVSNWTEPFATYALMNEVIYQYNRNWAFGTRFGVLNENSYGRNADWYTVSLGSNWTPNKWLTVKPEVRYDWMKGKDGTPTAFDRNTKAHQFSGGLSAVVKF